jgi:hypothetical protein
MGRKKRKIKEEEEEKKRIQEIQTKKANAIIEQIDELNEDLCAIDDITLLREISKYIHIKKNNFNRMDIKVAREKRINAEKQRKIENTYNHKRRRESNIENAEKEDKLESLETLENLENLENLGTESIKSTLDSWKEEIVTKEKLQNIDKLKEENVLNSPVASWDFNTLLDCNNLIMGYKVKTLKLNFKLGEFYAYLFKIKPENVDFGVYLASKEVLEKFPGIHQKTQANQYKRLFNTLGEYKRFQSIAISMKQLVPQISKILVYLEANELERNWWMKD